MFYTFNDQGKTMLNLSEVAYLRLTGEVMSFALKSTYQEFTITYETREHSMRDFESVIQTKWCDINVGDIATNKTSVIGISGNPSEKCLKIIFVGGRFKSVPIDNEDKLMSKYWYIKHVLEN